MKRDLIALLGFAALVLGVALGHRGVVAWAESAPSPEIDWLYVPEAVPLGAPFAAWYGVNLPVDGSAAWVQLRICDADATCLLGARKELSIDTASGLVTATRSLHPGAYQVEFLVVRLDRLGVPRTVAAGSKVVTYG